MKCQVYKWRFEGMYPPVVDASSGKEVTDLLLTDENGTLINKITTLKGQIDFRTIAYDSSRDEEIEVIEPVVIVFKS